MGNIRARKETGNLFFDFRFQNRRCREQTALPDTPANRRKLQGLLEKIEAEITLGTFDYAHYFPDSPLAKTMASPQAQMAATITPLFSDFSTTWLAEKRIEWRASHYRTIQQTLTQRLLPAFGNKPVGEVTKTDILNFRASLASVPGRKGKPSLTASRINHVLAPLRMILNDAAERHGFPSPYHGIKALKVPRSDVEPFNLDEVSLILATVRSDFRNYYTVRFFTGMRTSEIDGLKWKYVDFERRQILVREALVNGETTHTKNDGSQREIDMSQPVYEALRAQQAVTDKSEYIFCARNGVPLNHNNVTKRVWYPLLRHLELRPRRPYQTRHTAATLWLAAGENPEWIARQMGHTTTEMLFRVYSRFVKNLTRRDGSAFEQLIKHHLSDKPEGAADGRQGATN
ncbi:MAG: site-specific integrase [Gammaproteobacteria bacterium]|nr:MAG: site-specific integrase [Gammaproteobacteria bacterium]